MFMRFCIMGIGYVHCATEQGVKSAGLFKELCCQLSQYYWLGAIKTSPRMFSAPFYSWINLSFSTKIYASSSRVLTNLNSVSVDYPFFSVGDRAIVVGLCWCDIQASSQTDWSPQWFGQPFSSDQFGFVAPVQSCYRSTWRYGCACKQYLVVDYIQELHSYLTYVPPRCSSSWIDCYWVPALCSEGGIRCTQRQHSCYTGACRKWVKSF